MQFFMSQNHDYCCFKSSALIFTMFVNSKLLKVWPQTILKQCSVKAERKHDWVRKHQSHFQLFFKGDHLSLLELFHPLSPSHYNLLTYTVGLLHMSPGTLEIIFSRSKTVVVGQEVEQSGKFQIQHCPCKVLALDPTKDFLNMTYHQSI